MNIKTKIIYSTFLALFATSSTLAAPRNSTVHFIVSATVPDPTFNFYAVGLSSVDTLLLPYIGGKFKEKTVKLGFKGTADLVNDLKASVVRSDLYHTIDGTAFELEVSLLNNHISKVEKLDVSPKSIVTAGADAELEYKSLELKVSPKSTTYTPGKYEGIMEVLFEAGV
ncbi:hypothetical protein [Vibrio cholerae]|uniref:hypothetical protein n=1 Tax=Vibrio cholerae TaxID=666 RepID=UPI002FE5CFDE